MSKKLSGKPGAVHIAVGTVGSWGATCAVWNNYHDCYDTKILEPNTFKVSPLAAQQKRIEELEGHIHEALWVIAVNLAYFPEDLADAQDGVVRAGLVADRLRENLFPDVGEPFKPFAEMVAECRKDRSLKIEKMNEQIAAL